MESACLLIKIGVKKPSHLATLITIPPPHPCLLLSYRLYFTPSGLCVCVCVCGGLWTNFCLNLSTYTVTSLTIFVDKCFLSKWLMTKVKATSCKYLSFSFESGVGSHELTQKWHTPHRAKFYVEMIISSKLLLIKQNKKSKKTLS